MKIIFVRHGLSEGNMSKTYSSDTTKDPLTKHGIIQAKRTGKILSKNYGVFDLIICSPYLRTMETAEILNKELNVKKIIYNDLIIEQYPEVLKKVANEKKYKSSAEMLKDKEKLSQYIDIKDLIICNNIDKKIKETTDPFTLYDLKKKLDIAWGKTLKHMTPKKLYNNDMKFLKYLKSLKKKCILVITHGGVMERFLEIITNTSYGQINYIDKTKPIVKDNLYKYYGTEGNCCIMGCLYDINEKQFKLIIPPNILHLQDLVDKEPNFYPRV